jgi:phenylacetate-CoA ligase
MRAALIARILRYRARLRRRERWSRARLEAHQSAALAELRTFALERSPFYARFHRGAADRPLADLPVLTKAALMDSFDEIVTDRSVRLADVQRYLESLTADELFHERYWVSATSGSSGRRSIVPSNRRAGALMAHLPRML